jgi:NTP pyrophosphatase (non-canonical NTP hydrolase)
MTGSEQAAADAMAGEADGRERRPAHDRAGGLQALVAAFSAAHGLEKGVEAATLDLSSEVGEIAKAILEASDYGRRPYAGGDSALEGEIGDALYSLLDLANAAGVDAKAALHRALAKYADRIATRGRAASS